MVCDMGNEGQDGEEDQENKWLASDWEEAEEEKQVTQSRRKATVSHREGHTDRETWRLSNKDQLTGPIGSKIFVQGKRYRGDVAIDTQMATSSCSLAGALPSTIGCQLQPVYLGSNSLWIKAYNFFMNQIQIDSIMTRGWARDISVNDIQKSKTCDFELSICWWTQDTTEHLDWTRTTGYSTGYGPRSDHANGSLKLLVLSKNTERIWHMQKSIARRRHHLLGKPNELTKSSSCPHPFSRLDTLQMSFKVGERFEAVISNVMAKELTMTSFTQEEQILRKQTDIGRVTELKVERTLQENLVPCPADFTCLTSIAATIATKWDTTSA